MTRLLNTSRGEITIRPALPDDAIALYELRLEALATYPEAFAADYDATVADSSNAWAELITKYAQKEQGVICIAVVKGQLVGMTALIRGHWPKTRHSGDIWGVYVNVNWQGLHIAEALIEECIDWAKAHELVVVKLGVTTVNTPAIRCYTRCGFTIYGIAPKVTFENNVYYDDFLMARPV